MNVVGEFGGIPSIEEGAEVEVFLLRWVTFIKSVSSLFLFSSVGLSLIKVT